MNRIAAFVVGGAVTIMCGACSTTRDGLPYFRDQDLTPEWLSMRTASAPTMHRVHSFSLLDQRGRVVTEREIAGHVTVVHFFYATCARVCPRTQSSVARWLRAMPSDNRIQVLSHTVQPERDSVAALAEYATMHEIVDARWRLLTGPRTTIESLAATSYFVNLTDGRSYGTTDLEHTETLSLIDQQGRIRGIYNGTLQLDMERMADDARVLLREPS